MLVCLLPVAAALLYLTPAENRMRKWLIAGIIVGLAGLFFLIQEAHGWH